MHTRHEHNGLTWVDLQSPTRDEVQDVSEEFGLEPLVAQEMLLPSTKPRAEFYPEHLYTVFHFPALRQSHHSREQEIDFIVGRRYLITTHYDTIDPLHKFEKVFEVNSLLERGEFGDHAGYVFFAMMRKLYRAIDHEIEYIRHDLAVIEEHIFSGHEVAMVAAISRAARDLLNMRQVIEPHRDALRVLEEGGARFFGAEFAPYLRALSDEYYRVHNHVMREAESLRELRETNDSLLTTKQNETMRMLTTMALITFPLTLVATVLGLRVAGNPFTDAPGAFPMILAVIAVFALFMIFFFRHKHWL